MAKKLSIRNEVLRNKAIKLNQLLGRNDLKDWEVCEASMEVMHIFEQVLKHKIFKKNPLLLYDKVLKYDQFPLILKRKSVGEHSINLNEAFKIFLHIFPKHKLSKQGKIKDILYPIRNDLQHDVFDIVVQKETKDLIGTLFSVLAPELEKMVGKFDQPKKTEKLLTRKEVDEIFKNNLKKKLEYNTGVLSLGGFGVSVDPMLSFADEFKVTSAKPLELINTGSYDMLNYPSVSSGNLSLATGSLRCPRCKRFSLNYPRNKFMFVGNVTGGDLYICNNCHLELTEEEHKASLEL